MSSNAEGILSHYFTLIADRAGVKLHQGDLEAELEAAVENIIRRAVDQALEAHAQEEHREGRKELRALLAVANVAKKAHRDHPTTCGSCRVNMAYALSRLEKVSRVAKGKP